MVTLKGSFLKYVAFVSFSYCKLTINKNSLVMMEGRLQSIQQLCQNKGRLKRFVELHDYMHLSNLT